jgi:hypothetical protein
MFGLFIKPQASRRRQTRPRNTLGSNIEALESRWCLSDFPTVATIPGFGLPPSLTLEVAEAPGRTAILSGQVTDETPATVVVSFGGVAGGSTSPDGSGAYSLVSPATGLGTVTALAVDEDGLTGTAEAELTSMPPFLSLSLSYGEQRWVTLSGTVSDEVPGGLTVTFTGVVSSSITTNADGSFALTVQASALGDISATTADQWGLTSNTETVTVTSNAPSIADFGGYEFSTGWLFEGVVSDESPGGLVVTFGGVLAGYTATVSSNGNFSLHVNFTTHVDEIATAQVTDWWGLTSEIAMTLVQTTN